VKRKVLILASWYPSQASTASGIFIQDQAVALSRVYDIAVLVPVIAGLRTIVRKKAIPRSQVEQHAEGKVYREAVIIPPFVICKTRLASYFYAKSARRGIEKVITTWGKPDIIHAHVILPAGWMAVSLGREYRVPVVLTEHSGPFSMHLQSAYQRRLVLDTLLQAQRITAVSPALAKQIQAFLPNAAVDVVGNAVRTDYFAPLSEEKEALAVSPRTRFLTVALLNKGKGVEYLLEAARMIIQRGIQDFELIIGGDGPDRSRLEALSSSLGLTGYCRFLGMLTRSQVRDWLRRCDVFVLPSLAETFGVALGEAMACGKPVISTRCGGPEFIVTPETGVLVGVADSAALAASMSEFISGRLAFDPERIRQSVHRRFGPEAIMHAISSIYEQIWASTEVATKQS
jgi:glycosyltransferase involved in cell wall biosynthesis